MVGGMGHSLMVSLGHSVNKKKRDLFDGDELLMHFGSLRTSGIFEKLKAYSLQQFLPRAVGGQRTFSENLKFTKIAKELG